MEIVPFEDGLLIYQPERDRLHHINRTAIHVLELSARGHSAQETSDELMRAYGLRRRPDKEVAAVQAMLASEKLEAAAKEAATVAPARPDLLFVAPSIRSFPIDGLAEFCPLWFLQNSPPPGVSCKPDSV